MLILIINGKCKLSFINPFMENFVEIFWNLLLKLDSWIINAQIIAIQPIHSKSWVTAIIAIICCNCRLPSKFCISGGVPVLLSPGIHSFPFKLGLPLGLPSTFLGKHGWVQYYCKTALKEAHTGLAHKNQQVFIVMNPIDLNQEPAILAVNKASDIIIY